MGERDFIALIDGVHQLVKAPLVLVRDRLNTHVSCAARVLIAEREWLTVFLLPAYSPELNPVEGVWAHVKRSLADLAVVALDRLEALVRNRLKRLQYRPDVLNGFMAGTDLALETPRHPDGGGRATACLLTQGERISDGIDHTGRRLVPFCVVVWACRTRWLSGLR